MACRPKKFADGGGVREGKNANIDDETRARALKFVQGEGDQEPARKPAAVPVRKASSTAKPAAKPTPAPAKPAATQADARKADNAMADKAYAERMKPEAQAVKPDTSVEEALLGGKMAKAGLGMLKSAAPAASKSTALAEKFDKITPIPSRTQPAAQAALPSPKTGGPALGSPSGTPALGGPSASARVGGAAAPKSLPAPTKTVGTPKPKAKPKAKQPVPKGAKAPAASKRTKKFNDDEAGVEFKRGGAVKRGWGAARSK